RRATPVAAAAKYGRAMRAAFSIATAVAKAAALRHGDISERNKRFGREQLAAQSQRPKARRGRRRFAKVRRSGPSRRTLPATTVLRSSAPNSQSAAPENQFAARQCHAALSAP